MNRDTRTHALLLVATPPLKVSDGFSLAKQCFSSSPPGFSANCQQIRFRTWFAKYGKCFPQKHPYRLLRCHSWQVLGPLTYVSRSASFAIATVVILLAAFRYQRAQIIATYRMKFPVSASVPGTGYRVASVPNRLESSSNKISSTHELSIHRASKTKVFVVQVHVHLHS